MQCQTKSPFANIKRGTLNPLLYQGDCWLPSTISTAAELTAVMHGPPYHLSSQAICVHGLLTQRRVTIPLPREVVQEEPEWHTVCVWVPLMAKALTCGGRERDRFPAKARVSGMLCPQLIYSDLVSPLSPGRWNIMLVNFRQPFCTCSCTVAICIFGDVVVIQVTVGTFQHC